MKTIAVSNETTTLLIEKNKTDVGFVLKNGVLFFKEVPFSGIVNEYYASDKKKSSSQYYQGKREGFYKGWYLNGNKWFQRFYAKGLKVKTHKGWFLNGHKMFEYYFNDKGEYNGKVAEWYENGQKLKEFHFVDGVEDGSQKMWQPNGKIKANYVTKKGERFGVIGLKKCYSVNTKNEVIQ